MGKVLEKVTVKNYTDLALVEKNLVKSEEVRAIEIEAIVDTGASMLCLPPAVIKQLGLSLARSRTVKTANGRVTRNVYSIASITIHDRKIRMDVMENDEDTPPLIGYLVLESMDFVVDPKSQKLIGNPEHEGKWVMDLY